MKTYTVKMYRAYGPHETWTCQAANLLDAVKQFRKVGDRKWMSAYVQVDGGKRSYNVDSFTSL